MRGDCRYNPSVNESPKLYLEDPDKERLTVILSAVAEWVKEAGNFRKAPSYEVLDGRASFKGTYNALIDLEHIIHYGLKPESFTKITDPWQRLQEILQEKTTDLEPTVSEENLKDLLAIREAESTQNG